MPRETTEAIRNALAEIDSVKPEPPRPLMRQLPPADPFPVDALGDILAPAARAIHDRVRAPIAMCAQSVLAAATLAVQGHANVVLPTEQARPLSIYFASVGVTGERKTAVDTEATWPVRKREAKLREIYDAQHPDYLNAVAAWEKARDHAKTTGKGDRLQIKARLDSIGSAPDAPLLPLLTCSEPTYEGLVKLLAAGQPSLGLFNDEGGQFIGGHGMSDDAKLRTATGLSRLWDGQPIDRVRGGDGVTVLPGRRLAMHLMVQPAVAAMLFADGLLADQGLLSRVLPTAPDSAIGTRIWREPSADSDAAINGYGARLLHILEMPLPLTEGRRNELSPRELPLSKAARRLWIAFHDHIEHRIGAGGELEPVRGLANKLPEHAARIASLLALVRDITAAEVAEIEMQAGIDLAQHYAVEALRLHGASQVDETLQLAERLRKWLMTWPESAISLPEIYQLGPNAIRDSKKAAKLVDVLVEHGCLIAIPDGATIGEQRRRKAWRIVKA